MANQAHTTPNAVSKAPPHPPLSPADLAEAVERLAALEADVVGCPSGDLAFDAWLTETEAQRAHVSTLAMELATSLSLTASQEAVSGPAMAIFDMLHAGDPDSYDNSVTTLLLDLRNAIGFANETGDFALFAAAVRLHGAVMKLLSFPDYCLGNELSLAAQDLDQAA